MELQIYGFLSWLALGSGRSVPRTYWTVIGLRTPMAKRKSTVLPGIEPQAVYSRPDDGGDKHV